MIIERGLLDAACAASYKDGRIMNTKGKTEALAKTYEANVVGSKWGHAVVTNSV